MKFEDFYRTGKEKYNQGLYLEAIDSYRKALSKNPSHEECYCYMGECYEKMHYETKAIECYQQGLALCADTKHISNYHLNIGNCYIMLSELEKALMHFAESEKYDMNYLICQYNKAIVYTCQKEYKKALSLFKHVWDNGITLETTKRYIEYCTMKNKSV